MAAINEPPKKPRLIMVYDCPEEAEGSCPEEFAGEMYSLLIKTGVRHPELNLIGCAWAHSIEADLILGMSVADTIEENTPRSEAEAGFSVQAYDWTDYIPDEKWEPSGETVDMQIGLSVPKEFVERGMDLEDIMAYVNRHKMGGPHNVSLPRGVERTYLRWEHCECDDTNHDGCDPLPSAN